MRRSGIKIMGKLVVLAGPLLPFMLLAILLGTLGQLCAIMLTPLAVLCFFAPGALLGRLFWLIGLAALLRGILHYGEQQCNHYIAFKLLAVIRHRVFAKLRTLCPAKLSGRDKGELISVITSDIELLEVFYAHTISPIAIAVLVCLILLGVLGNLHLYCIFPALLGYLTVGAALPLWNSARGRDAGVQYRTAFSALNSRMLENLRGLRELLQYGQCGAKAAQLREMSDELAERQKRLSFLEADQTALTGLAILGFSFCQLFLTLSLYGSGQLALREMLLALVLTLGSFGPVTALSNLSNNLTQTLACGERVLRLLEEAPETEDVTGKKEIGFAGAACEAVCFSYRGAKSAAAPTAAADSEAAGACAFTRERKSDHPEIILQDFCLDIPKGQILGIHGRSGCGKSTLLRLLMRFWDVESGSIRISGQDIREINTENLRQLESFVEQETVLFHDTIAGNIAVAKQDASREEIVAAARKAALHDFIMTLPQGYDTPVAELGQSLSGGERQRIGIARAFLHDAPFLLLDEPTSNLDSLNEGMVLKALREEGKGKTVVLVSHRHSTLGIADSVLEFDSGRES